MHQGLRRQVGLTKLASTIRRLRRSRAKTSFMLLPPLPRGACAPTARAALRSWRRASNRSINWLNTALHTRPSIEIGRSPVWCWTDGVGIDQCRGDLNVPASCAPYGSNRRVAGGRIGLNALHPSHPLDRFDRSIDPSPLLDRIDRSIDRFRVVVCGGGLNRSIETWGWARKVCACGASTRPNARPSLKLLKKFRTLLVLV